MTASRLKSKKKKYKQKAPKATSKSPPKKPKRKPPRRRNVDYAAGTVIQRYSGCGTFVDDAG